MTTTTSKMDIEIFARAYPEAFREIVWTLGFAVSNAEAYDRIERQQKAKWRAVLRDQFAMAALSGLLSENPGDCYREATWAYQYADAMLAARDAKP